LADVLVVPTGRGARAHAEPIRLLVVEEQPLFLAALAAVLTRPPISAEVWTVDDFSAVPSLVREHRIDVVLCGMGHDHSAATKLAAELLQTARPVRTMLLAEADDADHLIDTIRAGSAGIFTKDISLEDFVAGVAAVVSGHRVLGTNILEYLVGVAAEAESPPRKQVGLLSPAELEILALVGAAHSVSEIAAARGISAKTVRNHIANIYRKLRITSRVEAILWVNRIGLDREAAEPAAEPPR
jgi:DNA-binding NarL/FixJ family response regulator